MYFLYLLKYLSCEILHNSKCNFSNLLIFSPYQWYISCASMEAQRERLIKRHLETWSVEKTKLWGEGEVGAARKADANDVLNARFIEHSAKYADVMINSL